MISKNRAHFDAVQIALNAAISQLQTNELGSYDAQQLANQTYFALKDTNGFNSLDLAGFIIGNSRKLGVAVHQSGR